MNLDIKTHSTEPVVFVIMPVFNGERYIEAAIRSVIAQTYPNWRLTVIDDSSTDSTVSVVQRLAQEDPRIRLIQNPVNVGVARSRNRGLDLFEGDYAAFLDADDIWRADKLSMQIERMTRENADLVYSSYAIIDSEGNQARESYIVPGEITFEELLKENVIGCSTVLVSCAVAEKIRFKEDFYHEDYCQWLELLRDGYKAVGCSEVLVDWRLILNSRSFNKKHSAINRWRIYRKHLNIPVAKSAVLFLCYMIRGIKKYYGKS